MEARLAALEDRLRQTEEVLVAERLARQTAEAAQQAVGPTGPTGLVTPMAQSLVDTRAIGKPPTFSGDVDPNGHPEGMTWSQWSFIFPSYVGAFDPGATRLLQQVETKVEDPAVVVNTTMTDGERRLSIQRLRRVPEGFLFCKEFEPRLPSRFQGMLQAILSPTTTDVPVQTCQRTSNWQFCRGTCATVRFLVT